MGRALDFEVGLPQDVPGVAWPRGSGEVKDPDLDRQDGRYAAVTAIQTTGRFDEEEPFPHGDPYAEQGFLGSGADRAHVLTSRGEVG